MRAAIDELAPVYRAAFVLREYNGLDYDEIARALQVDLGTVKSRLSRSRAQLRAKLREHAND
jgi:RNA polymerase sigma-70 factor (ECF subfamily)